MNKIIELKKALVKFECHSFDLAEEETSLFDVDLSKLQEMTELGIAHTAMGDDGEYEIQVYLNVRDLKITKEVSGEDFYHQKVTSFSGMEELILFLENSTFQGITNFEIPLNTQKVLMK